MSDLHLARRLERALADDERTNELGVRVVVTDDRVVAAGEVASEERRQAVLAVLRDEEPGRPVDDQLTLSAASVGRQPGHERIEPAG